MKIDYTFKIDGYFHSVNYYRSESPIDINNLPVPTAQGITGLSYRDETVQKDKQYYVRFGSVKGETEKVSEQVRVSTWDQLWYSSPVVVDISSNNATLYHGKEATITRNTMGGVFASNAHIGGVLAPNSCIYCIPFGAQNVTIINTLNDTTVQTNFGLDMSGGSKWAGGVLARNGKIYCAPQAANGVLIIDPATNTAELNNFGLDLSAGGKYVGAVLGADDKVYCIPFSASKILVIDPNDNTAELKDYGLSLTSTSKFYGGVLAPNGKIYCAPMSNQNALVIDTVKNSAILTNFGLNFSALNKWTSGVLGADGKIYYPPFYHSSVLVIDPNNNTAIEKTFNVIANSYVAKYLGGALGGDGKIYCNAMESDLLVIDTVAQTAVKKMYGGTTARFYGSITAQSGDIYCVPFVSSDIMKISMHTDVPDVDIKYALSPHFNKF